LEFIDKGIEENQFSAQEEEIIKENIPQESSHQEIELDLQETQ
jgi:hypothetical protein